MTLASRLLVHALSGVVRAGSLHIVAADGERLTFGDGSGRPVAIRFTDSSAQWAFLIDPDLRTGELFTDGRLIMEEGSVYDLLALVLSQADDAAPRPVVDALDGVRASLSRLGRNNPRRARRNVAHHYDLDDRLYALFLDPEWQYSCAYYARPDMDLAEAQRAKQRHIAAKLLLRPGDRVLDIGCGWGGLACFLAETAGAREVTGVTLSEEQLSAARSRAAARGLSDRVSFELQDYRAVEGSFQRIVSVGMFEHVGRNHYRAFFEACRKRLTEDGVMVLHTIGSTGTPSLTNPWITRYIFPGGYLPSLSEILPQVERAGLRVLDVEVLRLHYASTLKAWRDSFMARRAEAAALFDERFCRMWEYYLALSEAAFRHEDIVVFQLQLGLRSDAAPITRDYIAATEAKLEARRPPIRPQRPLAPSGERTLG